MAGFLKRDQVQAIQKTGLAKALEEAKTPADRRRAEVVFMRPDPIPPYSGAQPTNQGMHSMAVLCQFTNEVDYQRFRKYVKIGTAGGQISTHHLTIFSQLFQLLEDGVLTYEEGKLHVAKKSK